MQITRLLGLALLTVSHVTSHLTANPQDPAVAPDECEIEDDTVMKRAKCQTSISCGRTSLSTTASCFWPINSCWHKTAKSQQTAFTNSYINNSVKRVKERISKSEKDDYTLHHRRRIFCSKFVKILIHTSQMAIILSHMIWTISPSATHCRTTASPSKTSSTENIPSSTPDSMMAATPWPTESSLPKPMKHAPTVFPLPIKMPLIIHSCPASPYRRGGPSDIESKYWEPLLRDLTMRWEGYHVWFVICDVLIQYDASLEVYEKETFVREWEMLDVYLSLDKTT